MFVNVFKNALQSMEEINVIKIFTTYNQLCSQTTLRRNLTDHLDRKVISKQNGRAIARGLLVVMVKDGIK